MNEEKNAKEGDRKDEGVREERRNKRGGGGEKRRWKRGERK